MVRPRILAGRTVSLFVFDIYYGNAVVALAVLTCSEGLYALVPFEERPYSAAQSARSLAVYNGDAVNVSDDSLVDILINRVAGVLPEHSAHIKLGLEAAGYGCSVSLFAAGLFLCAEASAAKH